MHLQSNIAVGGFAVFKTTSADLATHLLAQSQADRQVTLFFANTNFVVQCRGLHGQMAEEGIVIVNDGIGMDIAARLVKGDRFRENLNGTDFLPFLFSQAPTPLKVFMVGGKSWVLQKAAQHVTLQLGQIVVGTCDGYECIKNSMRLVDKINQSQAEIVLVALGNPIQEQWLLNNRHYLNARILSGVGALFDFWAGNKPRAPIMVQKMKMEWFYRLCLEPQRLFPRYTVDILRFLKHCYKHR